MKNAHQEAKARRLKRLLSGIEERDITGVQKDFLHAFIVTEHNLTNKEVEAAKLSRTSLTFRQVEQLLGIKQIEQLSDDWDKAKAHFVELSKTHSLRHLVREVEEERRSAAESSVAGTVADTFGEELAQLKRQLEQG